MANTTATQIQQLYVGLLGRAADQGGLNWWADQVTTGGKTLEDVRASFVTSTEYTTTYGAAATRADLVTSIYQNLFERTPSADEVKYWAETDTRPADQLVAAFIEFAGAADQAVINNKTFVAQTYTDTAGADFNAAAAVSVIANVDGTPSSVADAIAAIGNGTLPGQIPGVAQINALATAQAGVVTFEAANKATADALVAKIDASNKAAGYAAGDTLTDNIDASSTYAQKVAAVVADAAYARGKVSGVTTNVLTADAGDKAAAVTTAYNNLANAAEKALADKFVAATAAEATAKAAQATDIQKAAVEAGLATAATTLIGAGKTYTTGADVTAAYVAADANGRKAIDLKFKDVAYYSTFKEVAVKAAAYSDAVDATAAAKDALVLDIVANPADATGTAAGKAYSEALTAKTDADTLLASAKTADADIAAAKALKDAYAVPTKVVSDAQEAVDKVAVTGEVAVVKLDGNATAGTGTEAAPIKDVFYFADKSVASDAGSDFQITSFAAGDSIVLGTSTYTFNSGALTTGDNNALEFFVVNSDAGVQIVLETSKFGSASVAADATTGVVAPVAGVTDAVAVITLTGVTAEHVSVANGVVSYV